MKDYYIVLGIAPTSSPEEIRTAYRKLSLKFHPDKNNNENYFEKQFKEIQEAYETLSNASKKINYDFKLDQFTIGNRVRPGFGQTPNEIKSRYEKEIKRRVDDLKTQFEKKGNGPNEKFNFQRNGAESPGRDDYSIQFLLRKYWLVIFFFLLFAVGNLVYLSYQLGKLNFGKSYLFGMSQRVFMEKPVRMTKANPPKPVPQQVDTAKGIAEDSIIVPPDELKQYFENGKTDPNIGVFRQALDYYALGNLSPGNIIDTSAVDSILSYDSKYLKSKFMIASSTDDMAGGVSLKIMFIDKPDRGFEVGMFNNRIVHFRDAHLNPEIIHKIRMAKIKFNPQYAF